ncbi:MAG TPA: hypothetical protein VFE86_05130 [Ilumatobacteraceae bacterium]|nr:hypothetical protein [Ilumatobacteraceae bacterium]
MRLFVVMKARDEFPDIHETMAAQHGAAATRQVRAEIAWRTQRALLDKRVWQQDDHRVVTSRSTPDTWHRRVMIATLASRGVASHGTAARLHACDGFNWFDEVHITLRYSQRRHHHPGAVTHVSRVLEVGDQLLVHGIPTVILPVCLIQLADDGSDEFLKALEGAMRDGVNPAWIRQVAARYDRPSLPGTRRLVRALDERVDNTLPRSWFQRMAARLLAEAGIETVDEHPIYDGPRLLAQLDLAIPELRIGIECQSWQWHATPADQQRDLLRKRRLRRMGWDITDCWWSDIDRMDDLVDTLRTVIAERSERL